MILNPMLWNYREAGNNLSGQIVEYVWRKPDSPYEGGQAMQVNGRSIVILDPSWPAKLIYDVLLHECGHHRDWGTC